MQLSVHTLVPAVCQSVCKQLPGAAVCTQLQSLYHSCLCTAVCTQLSVHSCLAPCVTAVCTQLPGALCYTVSLCGHSCLVPAVYTGSVSCLYTAAWHLCYRVCLYTAAWHPVLQGLVLVCTQLSGTLCYRVCPCGHPARLPGVTAVCTPCQAPCLTGCPVCTQLPGVSCLLQGQSLWPPCLVSAVCTGSVLSDHPARRRVLQGQSLWPPCQVQLCYRVSQLSVHNCLVSAVCTQLSGVSCLYTTAWCQLSVHNCLVQCVYRLSVSCVYTPCLVSICLYTAVWCQAVVCYRVSLCHPARCSCLYTAVWCPAVCTQAVWCTGQSL